jgi:hypothetical protein
VHRLLPTVVYGARGADVRLTVVAGKVVYDGTKVVGVDENLLRDELRARAFSIAARLGDRLPKARPVRWHQHRCGPHAGARP